MHDERILAIYRHTIDALYRYVSRNCGGDRTLAEDVTQETWLRAVREWRKKGPPDQPIGWLTTVARNLLVSYFRRHRPAQLDVSAAELLAALDDGRARWLPRPPIRISSPARHRPQASSARGCAAKMVFVIRSMFRDCFCRLRNWRGWCSPIGCWQPTSVSMRRKWPSASACWLRTMQLIA